MSEPPPVVYVIDDSESVRKAVQSLIRSVGLAVKVFATTREYLQGQQRDTPSCLILDVRLAGKSGLDFQRELLDANIHIPVIFITGHGDIPMSVRAMKAGAVDFITKPFRDQDLLDAIQIALEQDRNRRLSNVAKPQKEPGEKLEFPRANDNRLHSVEPQVIRGSSNAQIGETPLHNELLLNLPDEECQFIFPLLTFLPLRAQDVLNESGEPIKVAYFVNEGLVSMLNVMENGRSVEVGSVGREGFVGMPLLVGFESSGSRVVVQVEGSGFRLASAALVELLPRCPVLGKRLQRYVQLVGLQSTQVAACNRVHQVEQRLARWLLMCQDRISSSLVPLTQESFAHLLGVNRSSVTVAAGILQTAKLIAYTPGHVTLLDRDGLEEAACECYGAIEEQASKWNKESRFDGDYRTSARLATGRRRR
jgi:FixJ family two-component response regulator/CRP-like cAMP-binding protein